jgi:hypothetical protein
MDMDEYREMEPSSAMAAAPSLGEIAYEATPIAAPTRTSNELGNTAFSNKGKLALRTCCFGGGVILV